MTAQQARMSAIEQNSRVYKIDDDHTNPNYKPIMDPDLADIVLVK